MKYKVKKAIKIVGNKEYESSFICDPIIPVFHICKFLDLKGKNSLATQKTYASILVQWLNFLGDKKYYEIEYLDLKKYIQSLIFFNEKKEYVINPILTYKTLVMKNKVISAFYKFLHTEISISNNQNGQSSKVLLVNPEKLEQLGLDSIDYLMIRYKKSRKEKYILEYSEDMILSITSGFNLLRDKIVFLLTLYGFRIDEVLSIKVKDLDFENNIISPSRSKTNKNRYIVVSNTLMKNISNYLKTDRLESVIYSGFDSEYLFLNQNKGKFCGKELQYSTFYSSLKTSAKKVGLDPESIRTHSGRSTKTMQLLKNDKVSDEMIRYIMGWKNPSSISSYIDEHNKSLALKGAKFISDVNEKIEKKYLKIKDLRNED